jgi:hypothetical protein
MKLTLAIEGAKGSLYQRHLNSVGLIGRRATQVCERYGGGHARVGAISFEPGAIEKARRVAAEIVAE